MRHEKVILAILLFAAAFSVSLTFSQVSADNTPTPECTLKILSAAFELAERDFLHLAGMLIPAMNDIRCEEEHMANVVIIVTEWDGQKNPSYSYAIFHIHFSPAGKLISAANFLPAWQPLRHQDAWKGDWCNIISSVYPKELKEQGCE